MVCVTFGLWFVLMCACLTESAKIVAFSCNGSPSHKYVSEPLLNALVEEGHDVTVVTAFKSKRVSKFKEIFIGRVEDTLDTYLKKRIDGESIFYETLFDTFPRHMQIAFDKTWENPEFQELLKQRVDLVISDSLLNEFALGFVHIWNAKLIYLAVVANIHINFAALGHQYDYALFPFMTTTKQPPFGLIDRALQFVSGEIARVIRRFDVSRIENKLSKFVKNVPPFLEIEQQRLSLILGNFDNIVTEPHPVPPNYVRLGAMTCTAPKPQPKNLEAFIAQSGDQGFAIFSLGTGVVMSSMPETTRQAFVNVFRRYNLHVIWKWSNTSSFPDQDDNLYLTNWVPSLNDLLGHAKARIFISHGGLLGIQEAIYHGVPVLGIPVFADQDNNVRRLERIGVARLLEWRKITEEMIEEAVGALLYDHSYRQKAKKFSKMAQNPLAPWRDVAMHHINMVLDNEHLDFMKIPSNHLNVLQRNLLDVYIFLFALLFLWLYFVWVLLKYCLKLTSSKQKQE